MIGTPIQRSERAPVTDCESRAGPFRDEDDTTANKLEASVPPR